MKRLLLTVLAASILLSGAFFVSHSQAAIQTFGLTANNGSVQTNSADRKYVYSATPSSSGTVVSGAARIWNGGTVNSDTNLVIYSDTAGEPDALLAVSDTLTVNTGTSEAERDYTFSGANQINITSGTPYWIGVHFSDPGTGNMSISRANTSSLTRSDPDTYSDGPTDPCSCATVSNGGLDIYIEYDDAVGGGVSVTPKTGIMGGSMNIQGGSTWIK